MALLDDIRALPADMLATRSSVQIAAALSAGRTRVGAVSRASFAIWCGKTGLRAAIEDTAATTGHPLRASALTLLDFLRGGVAAELDFSIADNQAMLAAWQAAGAITQAQHDDLLALATVADPIDEMEVRLVCWSDAGEWLP